MHTLFHVSVVDVRGNQLLAAILAPPPGDGSHLVNGAATKVDPALWSDRPAEQDPAGRQRWRQAVEDLAGRSLRRALVELKLVS